MIWKSVSGKDAQSFETLWLVNGCACNSLLYSKSHSQSRKQIYRSPWVNIHNNIYISQVKSVNQGTSTTQPLLHHLHEGRTVYLWHSYGSTMYDASHPSSILHLPFLHVNGLIASFQQRRPDRFFGWSWPFQGHNCRICWSKKNTFKSA